MVKMKEKLLGTGREYRMKQVQKYLKDAGVKTFIRKNKNLINSFSLYKRR